MSTIAMTLDVLERGDHWPVDLTVYGPPTAKGRPRHTRQGRTFTPAATRRAEQTVRTVWEQAGQPTVPAVALEAHVDAVLERPASHFGKRGLNATGLRAPHPAKVPDVDNLWKLAIDALNGVAIPDDRYVVRASITKRWAHPHERPHTRIRIRPLDQED